MAKAIRCSKCKGRVRSLYYKTSMRRKNGGTRPFHKTTVVAKWQRLGLYCGDCGRVIRWPSGHPMPWVDDGGQAVEMQAS